LEAILQILGLRKIVLAARWIMEGTFGVIEGAFEVFDPNKMYTPRLCDAVQGTIEMLLAGAICGFCYAIFAGQPLTIIGATGPLLVFESIVCYLCEYVICA